MQIPPAAASALNLNQSAPLVQQAAAPPITTQCFLLANMFDPNAYAPFHSKKLCKVNFCSLFLFEFLLSYSESAPNWDVEIKDDVIEECNRHGGCVHVFVDKASPQGNVYVKCPTINTAVAAVNSLHGRWFGGKFVE